MLSDIYTACVHICCLYAFIEALHLLVLHCIGNELCASVSLSEWVCVCEWVVHTCIRTGNSLMHVLQDMLYLTLLYSFTSKSTLNWYTL